MGHGVPSVVVCYYCCTGGHLLNPIVYFQIANLMTVTSAIKKSLTNPCIMMMMMMMMIIIITIIIKPDVRGTDISH